MLNLNCLHRAKRKRSCEDDGESPIAIRGWGRGPCYNLIARGKRISTGRIDEAGSRGAVEPQPYRGTANAHRLSISRLWVRILGARACGKKCREEKLSQFRSEE